MFGFLKGSRPSSRANSRASSPAPRGVKLQINVPSYGGVFMTGMGAEGDADADAEDGAQFLDRELSGELEIDVPRGMGRRRCRAIRLTLKNVARLNMGDGRGWEEDVLFERTLEMKGAIILEEGLQRYDGVGSHLTTGSTSPSWCRLPWRVMMSTQRAASIPT